jgi:Flp pilus assembly pilin Flp
MKARQSWIKWLPDNDDGATAVEFAIVAPVFLALVFGIVQISLLAFTVASLNYAVEKAARCDAVRTNCPAPISFYYAPGAPNFAAPESRSCGVFRSATISYNLNVLAFQRPIQLSAQACFPDLKTGA